jgi:hypothetical protein
LPAIALPQRRSTFQSPLIGVIGILAPFSLLTFVTFVNRCYAHGSRTKYLRT